LPAASLEGYVRSEIADEGVPLEDVSKLLGHASIAVTEKYYAPWVVSRKLRLERLLSETLAGAKSD
jgi:integrase